MRDEHDLPFAQFVLDSFASFVRTHDPNPDPAFLAARGYLSTLQELETAGRWAPVTRGDRGNGTMRLLAWPTSQAPFREEKQCQALGLGVVEYYG